MELALYHQKEQAELHFFNILNCKKGIRQTFFGINIGTNLITTGIQRAQIVASSSFRRMVVFERGEVMLISVILNLFNLN